MPRLLSTGTHHTVEEHFSGRASQVRAIYDALLEAVRMLGPFAEDPKKTSIHLTRRSTFAGVAMRSDAVILTVKSDRSVAHRRVRKADQSSARRWYLEIRLTAPADVDRQLTTWLRRSYELSA